MIGLGTVINVAGIITGGLSGLLFGKRMEERYQSILMNGAGICVLFLGIAGAMREMLVIEEGKLTSGGTIMMIASFSLGALIGEWMNIELGASLTVCIGAMAVVGAIQDGISGDYTVLTAKAILDLIIILVMTASFGKGCIFSAIPVALFQGTITILARFIQPVMTEQALSNLSLTGSILIFCVGVNLVWGKMIKVANLLPALVLAVMLAFIL